MACDNNKIAKIRWVYGNTKNVAITLKELVSVETGETADFDIQEGDIVTVFIKGTYENKEYTPTIEGNVLSFKVGAELTVGDYVIEVGVQRGEDSYMSRKRWELAVVRYDDEANIPDDAEFTMEDLELIAMMYIKGDMFTYDDMTDAEKYDLGFKIGQEFSIDNNGYLCINSNPVPKYIAFRRIVQGQSGRFYTGALINDNLYVNISSYGMCVLVDPDSGSVRDASISYESDIDKIKADYATASGKTLEATFPREITFVMFETLPDWDKYTVLGE